VERLFTGGVDQAKQNKIDRKTCADFSIVTYICGKPLPPPPSSSIFFSFVMGIVGHVPHGQSKMPIVFSEKN
jgi:hypothetical protein